MRVKAAKSASQAKSVDLSQNDDVIVNDGETSFEKQTSVSEDSQNNIVTIVAGINEKDARLIGKYTSKNVRTIPKECIL